MRNIILLLAIIASASAYAHNRPQVVTAEDHSEHTLFGFKELLAELNPKVQCLGRNTVQRLSPIRVDWIHIPIYTCLFRGEINIRCTELSGLDNIVIEDIGINIIQSRIPFKITLPLVEFRTSGDFALTVLRRLDLAGGGGMNIAVETLTAEGYMRYSVSLSGITMTELSLTLGLGDVTCKVEGLDTSYFINGAANLACKWAVREGLENTPNALEELINGFLLDLINQYIDSWSLQDLISWINNLRSTRNIRQTVRLDTVPESCGDLVEPASEGTCDYSTSKTEEPEAPVEPEGPEAPEEPEGPEAPEEPEAPEAPEPEGPESPDTEGDDSINYDYVY